VFRRVLPFPPPVFVFASLTDGTEDPWLPRATLRPAVKLKDPPSRKLPAWDLSYE